MHDSFQGRRSGRVRRSSATACMGVALIALLATLPWAQPSHAQHEGHGQGHRHGGPALYVAQLVGGKAVPRSPSRATGTGAFIVDPKARTMRFEVTYLGLETGPARGIGLYNFGAGGNGELVRQLCGSGALACPSGTSARIEGQWSEGDRKPIDNTLLGELATGRLYLQIDGGSGTAELRAQLEPNGAMVPVRNYVGHLTPGRGRESGGTGTVVLSETYLPGGRVEVFYQLTVSGTTDVPTGASIVPVPSGADIQNLRPTEPSRLTRMRLLSQPNERRGSTWEGTFTTRAGTGAAPLWLRREGTPERSLIVTTRRYPQGELFGVLREVR